MFRVCMNMEKILCDEYEIWSNNFKQEDIILIFYAVTWILEHLDARKTRKKKEHINKMHFLPFLCSIFKRKTTKM